MPASSSLKRTPLEWTWRVLLALVVLLLGYLGTTLSLANVLVRTDPARAHSLVPFDARVTARYAASLAGSDSSSSERARADALAREALREDPTAVVAVATLALNAQIRGEAGQADELFSFAQRLSRRNLQTQLWAIEKAVANGDVGGALREYDITLRVFPNMGEALFPVLAAAATDTRVRRGIVQALMKLPPWGDDFAKFAAERGGDPTTTALLFTDLSRAHGRIPEPATAALLASLLKQGRPDVAWSYYALVRGVVDRRRSRDPNFTAALGTPSVLDWVPSDVGGVTSSIEAAAGGGVFDFAVPATIGTPLLQQVQLLPPGTYNLVGHSTGLEVVKEAAPYWTLLCSDGRELGRVDVSNSGESGGRFSGSFSVPLDCDVQTLLLVARPSDALNGVMGQLNHVQLAPAP